MSPDHLSDFYKTNYTLNSQCQRNPYNEWGADSAVAPPVALRLVLVTVAEPVVAATVVVGVRGRPAAVVDIAAAVPKVGGSQDNCGDRTGFDRPANCCPIAQRND